MIAPMLLFLLAACLFNVPGLAWAGETRPHTYALADILALAAQHNPVLAGAEGLVKQSQGQQIAAGAYPNPSLTGIAGRGAIQDPKTGVHVTERTFIVEQPLEWTGKRRARQEAADAGLAGANAALEETRLSLLAEVKIAFYQLLFGQVRGVSICGSNFCGRSMGPAMSCGKKETYNAKSMKDGVGLSVPRETSSM